MDPSEAQTGLLRLLADHEEAMSELYRAYAAHLREEADFWMELAAEEAVHLEMVRRLGREVADGQARLESRRFSLESVEASLAHIRAETRRAETEKTSRAYALSMAMDIENGLIERKYFEAFDGDSKNARAVLNALARGTFAHLERVRQAWEKLQRG